MAVELRSENAAGRPQLPVVSHIITDEDVGLFQDTTQNIISLEKVIKLLKDPHSVSLYDRHTRALKKVAKHYENGFFLKDLVHVFSILNICCDKILEIPKYEEGVLAIFQLCSMSFLKEKSSDELVYEEIVKECISQLGYLMRTPSIAVQKQICKTLLSFYTEEPILKEIQKYQPCSRAYMQRMMEWSDISETLVKALLLVEDDLDVKLDVMNTLQYLSKQSAVCCNDMVKAHGAAYLCKHLMEPDPTGQLLFISVEILWNLLQLGNAVDVSKQLNNMDCISHLMDAFMYQLTQGYGHYDQQLRNDLLVITLLIAYNCPEAPFVATGFAKNLTLLATYPEVKSHSILVKHLKLSTCHEDFEMKKLLFMIVCMLSREASVIPVFIDGHLLLGLLSFVHGIKNQSLPLQWNLAEYEELQLLALDSLSMLIPKMTNCFMIYQGNTRLLLLLEWCVSEEKYLGQGNSFHGEGSRGNKRAQLRYCLRVLESVVLTGNSVILLDLIDQGAMQLIVSILSSLTDSKIANDAVDIEMQTNMLVVLSFLCDGDCNRKEILAMEIVGVLLHYLKTDAELFASGLGHNKLILAAVDCIWQLTETISSRKSCEELRELQCPKNKLAKILLCTICGCDILENYFLEKEGIFLFMDLLEAVPKGLHNIILSCLLDLCENPKMLNHIKAWRGKNGIFSINLLCRMWRDEEKELGVRRDKDGLIQDPSRPLMGIKQSQHKVTPLPANSASPAVLEVFENMRSKIFALISKLGFGKISGLTVEDEMTLTTVENYLGFKMGEVWNEIMSEIDENNLRPISPDRDSCKIITSGFEEQVNFAISEQEELVKMKKTQAILDEQDYYAEMRESHLPQEIALNDFAEFVARTSKYSLLKAAKQRQTLSVDASRIHTRYQELEMYHSTTLPKLQTTSFSGRHIALDSTPLNLIGGPLKQYSPHSGTLVKGSTVRWQHESNSK